jgi:dTDP-4-dehydrorhamnose 3,5-epimerase
VPRGQAKYVTVARGSAIDFIIDVRAGSPTFGAWDSVLLDTVDRRAVFLGEGLGHCFVALEDDTAVSYLVSDVYRPDAEHTVSPLDPAIGLDLPFPAGELIVSDRDAAAPTLQEALDAGILPDWEVCRALGAAGVGAAGAGS